VWQIATRKGRKRMAVAKTKRPGTQEKGRMHFRLDPEIKDRVARAAAITGQALTDFAVSTLTEKADEIIERHDTMLLNSEEYSFFLKTLDSEREPSARSRAAAERYKQGRREGTRYTFDN
jgi:uncharacterized protein (DUF1778 family)